MQIYGRLFNILPQKFVAKKVLKQVGENFPYVSPTRLCALERDTVVNNTDLRQNLISKQRLIEEKRTLRETLRNNPVEYYKQLIKDTKDIAALNCAEFSEIVFMMLKMNKVENCQIVTIQTGNKRTIDHTLVRINADKLQKNVFVDAWLGISGKTEKFVQNISNKFAHCFELVPNEKIKFINISEVPLEDIHITALRKEFPQYCL